MGTQIPTKEQGLQPLINPNPLPKEPYWQWRRLESEDENSGFSQIFGVLRRRLPVIVGVGILVTTGTAVWSSTLTPKYQGKFQLLVEPLKNSESELLVMLSETLKENVNDITRQTNTSLDYQALIQVLKSPTLMSPVIKELQARYPDINYDQLIGNDASGKLASGQDDTLYINRVTKGKDESRVIEVTFADSDPKKVQFVLDKVSQAYRKYSIEQQQTNLRQGIKFVDQQIPKLELQVNTLQGQLQTFQQRYGVYNPELQGEQLLNRANQVKLQRLETEKKLTQAKSLYASLKKQLGMQQNTAIAASALSESPQYQQILTRIQEIDTKIATESVRYTNQNPVIQSLREQRKKLLPLLNQEAQVTLGGNVPNTKINPQLLTYQNSVRRELIQQMADASNQVDSLKASLQTDSISQQRFNQQIREYPVIVRQYSNIQRKLQVATDTLNQLLAKQEALQVDAAAEEIPWQLIMPPIIPRDKTGKLIPETPLGSRNTALGGIAGTLLGVLAAFAIENSQDVFYDFEQLKRTIKLPILGVIPFYRQLNKPQIPNASNVVKFSPKEDRHRPRETDVETPQEKSSVFIEAFCSLYTRFKSINSDTSAHSIVVTSATKGDGKSTVATNFAQMAAWAGQRVLLVDADLEHPQLHETLNLSNRRGLSEVLSQGLDISQAIQQSPKEDNLFVLTAGNIPPNPAKLLSSKKMQNFIERSQAHFDLVVYDTPYLLGRIDANILAAQSDGVVLVTGLRKTPRSSIKQVLEELKTSRISVLGMVANSFT